jgi:hypothetical protein
VNELQADIEFPFAVLPEPSALFQLSEGALDDPAFGQHHKNVQLLDNSPKIMHKHTLVDSADVSSSEQNKASVSK